jgi:hypothetical protein
LSLYEAARKPENMRCRCAVNAFYSENQRMSFSRIRRFSDKKGEARRIHIFLSASGGLLLFHQGKSKETIILKSFCQNSIN